MDRVVADGPADLALLHRPAAHPSAAPGDGLHVAARRAGAGDRARLRHPVHAGLYRQPDAGGPRAGQARCVTGWPRSTSSNHEVLHEIRADGGTDYYALPMRISPWPADAGRDLRHRPRGRLLRRRHRRHASPRRHDGRRDGDAHRAQHRRHGGQHLSRPPGRPAHPEWRDPPRRRRGDPRRAVVLRPARLHRAERAAAARRGAGAPEQLLPARRQCAGGARRRDPEIHRRRRDGLFPGRGCVVPAHGDGRCAQCRAPG